MTYQKQALTPIFLAILVFLLAFDIVAEADSVYAIPSHWGAGEATLNVYDILDDLDEGKLEYRATYDLKYPGACDVQIDTQSNILFLTFENQDDIELVNARTFLSEGTVTAEGATDLAGLELDYIDPNTTRLYTVDRGTSKLFVYDWDAESKSLTLLPPDPNNPNNPNYPSATDYYTLLPQDPGEDPAVAACGLALDPDTGILYVSQYNGSYSSIIQAYETNDFETNFFPHERTIDLDETFEGNNNYAVDIDVDSANGWCKRIEVYAGQSRGNFV